MDTSHIKVLIVENEQVISTNLRLLLNKLGYSVSGITGLGEQAIELLKTVDVDIILMDIGLDGTLDGIETAHRIRAVKEIPIVFLTANTDAVTFQRAKKAQPYGYIYKPFDILQIQTNIEMAIARFDVDQRLNEQREWLSTTLSSIGDAVIATDDHGIVKFMNPVAEKLTGYTQAEATGKPLPEVFEIVNESSRMTVTNPVELVLKEGRTIGLANHTILISKDGTEYNIDDAAAPIYDVKNQTITGVVLTFRDITEKYQTEALLALTERKFRALVENSDDMVTMVNRTGEITYNSPATERISGYSMDEYRRLKIHDVFHPDDIPMLAQKNAYVRSHPNEPLSYQYRARKKNGEWIWLEGTSVNLIDNPKVGAIISNFRDITDRKNAEEKLHKSEELFRAMIEYSKNGITIIDKHGIVIYNSPSNQQIMGYTIEERLGASFTDIVHPDFLPIVHRLFQDLLNGMERADSFEALAKHKDGSWRWLEVSAQNFLSNPSIEAIVINFQDITVRKIATEKLLKSEEKYRSVIASLQEGITIQNKHGEIIDANESAQRILGLTLDQLQGGTTLDPHWRAIHEDGSEYPGNTHPSVRTLTTGESISSDIMGVQKPDGTLTWISINSEPLFKEGESTPDGVVVSFKDITERKVAEEELQKSNHRFEIVAKATKDGIWDHDLVAQTIWRNETLREIMNTDEISSTVMKDKWFDNIHPDDFQRITNQIQGAIEGNQSVWSAEYRVRQSDGSYHHFNDRGYVIRDSQGKAIRMIGALQDLTKYRNTEEKLRESEEKFRAVVQNITDIVVLTDGNGILLYYSPIVKEILGYEQGEVLGRSLFEFLHPDELDYVSRIFGETLQKPGNGIKLECRFRTKNNDYILLESQGNNQLDNPAISAIVITSRDITERNIAEQKIRDQAVLLDVVPDAIFVRSIHDEIITWSKGAEQMYGWTAEEAIGITSPNLLGTGEIDDFLEAKKVLRAKGHWSGEFRQKTKDGRIILVQSRWKMLQNFAGQLQSILVTNTNITEKKNLESQLFRAQRLESIGTLASGIAHDLNNVLTPVVLGMEIIKLKLTDESMRQRINTIISTVKRGSGLISQVLSFARGSQDERSILNVKYSIEEVAKIARETFPKEIDVITNLSSADLIVNANSTQIHQIIMNLCINARDAMELKGGTLKIEARHVIPDESFVERFIDAKLGSTYVAVTVSDEGKGIPQELHDKIFEPFFTTKEVGKGTGIGLTTVFSIVNKHEGFIHLYSEVNVGTSFTVYLPAETSLQFDTEIGNIEIAERLHSETILLVDDEDLIRTIAEDVLITYGYTVITATNGAEALQMYTLRKDEIALVLTDVMMPMMNGIDLITKLKAINPNVKTIAASGLMHGETSKKLLAVGVSGMLVKPYTADQLINAVREVIDVKRSSTLAVYDYKYNTINLSRNMSRKELTLLPYSAQSILKDTGFVKKGCHT